MKEKISTKRSMYITLDFLEDMVTEKLKQIKYEPNESMWKDQLQQLYNTISLIECDRESIEEGLNENDALDMTIRIMDKLSEMKVLNKKQSADKDFAIQDAITQEIEVVFNRISLKDQIDNNSISIGEFHNEK